MFASIGSSALLSASVGNKNMTPRGNRPETAGGSAPWGKAVLVGSAICGGFGTLVTEGRMQWPPTQLLASSAIIAGCLALVGPILLRKRGAADVGLGDLIWMAGGLLIWVFDAAALARGDYRTLVWANPLGYQAMGLIILAVGLAAWRCRLGVGHWSWTNVIGWTLGIFWVMMALMTMLPAKSLGIAFR